MKRALLKALNSLLVPLGVEISRASRKGGVAYQPVHDPSTSFMKDEARQELLLVELTEVARTFFAEQLSEFAADGFDFGGRPAIRRHDGDSECGL